MNHNSWSAIDQNNQITFNTAMALCKGLDIEHGDKRLENDKVFRARLLAMLGTIAIALCTQNQIELTKCEPSIIRPS